MPQTVRPVMCSLHYQLECTTNFLSIDIDCIFLLNFFWNDVFVKGLSITRIVVRYDTVVSTVSSDCHDLNPCPCQFVLSVF